MVSVRVCGRCIDSYILSAPPSRSRRHRGRSHLQEAGALRKLLDGQAAVAQHALVSVDVRHGAAAGCGVDVPAARQQGRQAGPEMGAEEAAAIRHRAA